MQDKAQAHEAIQMRSILTKILCIAEPLAHQIRDPHIYKTHPQTL
jgi:hypothetical protein